MTAPNGPILFNSSTGSDTAASGLGPDPAQSGTGASTTAGSAVVTGITTTGVTAGDLLWVESSSGRQFSIIASVDSGTQVTCDDTFANTESGRNWAIGGKRQTLLGSERLLEFDGKAGMDLQLESGYTETLSDTLDIDINGDNTSGSFTLRAEPGFTTRPVLTFTHYGTGLELRGDMQRIWNLELNNTNANKGNVSYAIWASNGSQHLRDIIIADPTNHWGRPLRVSTPYLLMEECEVAYGQDNGLFCVNVSSQYGRILNCVFHNHAHAPYLALNFGMIKGCIFHSNSGNGCEAGDNATTSITGNVFWGNSDAGLHHVDRRFGSIITENIFSENGTYGLSMNVSASEHETHENYINRNAYYANTIAPHWGSIKDNDREILLTADPFVSTANVDFNINNDPGGGALLRAATVVMP